MSKILADTTKLPPRILGFSAWLVFLGSVFSLTIAGLIRASLQIGYSSHIILVPLITVYLIWSDRHNIFASPRYGLPHALWVGALGLAVVLSGFALRSRNDNGLGDFFIVLGILLLIVTGFIAAFGTMALRKAIFPFSMLAFMLPVPGELLQKFIYFLQSQSADLSHWMFTVLHVPVLRNGFVMTLPGVTIEVAEECSGINSSIALMVLAILFAHETLRSNWRRVLLVLLTIPLSILKNAIRIVTLTLLAIKVDPGFLNGRLHHQGGFVFFLSTLVLAYPIWKILQSSERRALEVSNPQTLKDTSDRSGCFPTPEL